ncbi:MAG: DEAD/DEAH box helicase family protein [Candidatus Omnitrophica bacterium]|nr:DEAD/DEAH box helicase family protein [Candidatus Omnitrophota bacterium]
MQLKIYQENAIDELLEKVKRLLNLSGSKKLVFKSPTGSGKTIMMAEFLKRLVDDREIKQSLGFIWTAPRQLHIQSKEKLENYFETSRALKCSYFEDLDDRKISENEILFFNWESINKADNIYIRDNEQDFNLSKVLERTKEEGREIILIIDEAHHHATSEISQGLIQMISPKLTIEVSATPVLKNPDDMVSVDLEEVKTEGMIKKAIILNDQFVNLVKKGKIESKLSGSSDELVIDAALKKREELLKAYQKEGVKINPLVLIQLPDRIGQTEDEHKNLVIRILKDKYKISTDNGRLAIWLAGEHINKEEVEKPESEVEVLLFKQAIALGWDCPRAQILVLFRQWHSPIFSIQTVGRIMRMPEPEKEHYRNEVLNYGYVYTNLSDIEVKEDLAGGYLAIYTSHRILEYKPINLLSCYSVRHREKTRLSPLFISIFLDKAKEYGLKKKIDKKAQSIDMRILSDWKVEDIDELAGKHLVGDKSIKMSNYDFQKLFDFFVRKSLREGEVSLYPEDRSVDKIKQSIYKFFEIEFKMKRGEGEDEAIRLVLSDKNINHFLSVIDKAKSEYINEVSKRKPEIKFEENWNIPEKIEYWGEYEKEDRKKSVMQPFYERYDSKLEKAFIDFLEKSEKVKWWFKNEDRDKKFFAIPYDNGETKPFYVDFIVKLKDGKIGLFDTKTGLTKQVAGPKIDGLYKYIQSENKKGKKLFGGIVTNTDFRNYNGRWIYFDKESKELNENSFDNWVDLKL